MIEGKQREKPDGNVCPCKRVKCPRHGDCAACRAHHADAKRPRPCERERRRNR